jgi:hypothetical protein
VGMSSHVRPWSIGDVEAARVDHGRHAERAAVLRRLLNHDPTPGRGGVLHDAVEPMSGGCWATAVSVRCG